MYVIIHMKKILKFHKKIFFFLNILEFKNFGTHKIFFFIYTPKCIELNSEFVRPRKNLCFGVCTQTQTQYPSPLLALMSATKCPALTHSPDSGRTLFGTWKIPGKFQLVRTLMNTNLVGQDKRYLINL